ncbi:MULTISPECIES: hypothetical protein [unclassified Duganella]|uniref:hypothetical protein n=1 Tax=unclassified Duganella TaxID=2636909 RepID=UPI000A451D73|nr:MULTISPECIES: hypothetical protein [unclassified Duganella]
MANAGSKMAQAGRLELAAPAAHYLPDGYRHFHDPLRRTARDSGPGNRWRSFPNLAWAGAVPAQGTWYCRTSWSQLRKRGLPNISTSICSLA